MPNSVRVLLVSAAVAVAGWGHAALGGPPNIKTIPSTNLKGAWLQPKTKVYLGHPTQKAMLHPIQLPKQAPSGKQPNLFQPIKPPGPPQPAGPPSFPQWPSQAGPKWKLNWPPQGGPKWNPKWPPQGGLKWNPEWPSAGHPKCGPQWPTPDYPEGLPYWPRPQSLELLNELQEPVVCWINQERVVIRPGRNIALPVGREHPVVYHNGQRWVQRVVFEGVHKFVVDGGFLELARVH